MKITKRHGMVRPIQNYKSNPEEALQDLLNVVGDDSDYKWKQEFYFAGDKTGKTFNRKTEEFLSKNAFKGESLRECGKRKVSEALEAFDKKLGDKAYFSGKDSVKKTSCIVFLSHLGFYIKFGFVGDGKLTIVIHEG